MIPMTIDFKIKLKDALCCNDQDFLELHKNKYDINHRFADENNDSLLQYSIKNSETEVYKYLLSRGADLFIKNDLGEMILHSVIYSNKIERLDYLFQTYPSLTKIINDTNIEGITPILFSIIFEQKAFFDRFLQMGADIHLGEKEDVTPLHMACLIKFPDPKDNFEIVRTLVESGASVRLKTKNGHYPLTLAINNDFMDIAEYLFRIMYD
ncbi:hypothetical protein BKH42_08865 [Helicobacter sp. 13S00482-2]|uniref:ankyrin repeat domain-containing protein n=1 Tax=Helicobacter sp. 13S00482-2 TaxID=1476200 RepID=UPI000BA684A9|nr:ankyrin repeat domain-containing protein [Helicobacter sp. 13S00482-2]PAF52904.1 hypothetical protein BKH42_08865 [Helicobacter sp. 13S00482-2]